MKKEPRKPFAGEIMTCMKCGWQFQSHWAIETMWTAIEADGIMLYVCPRCWGVPRHLWPPEVKERFDLDHPTG